MVALQSLLGIRLGLVRVDGEFREFEEDETKKYANLGTGRRNLLILASL